MPANFQSLTPLRFLERSAAVFPEKLGIVCGDRRLTYREFAEEATRIGRALQASGIEPGDRVAYLCPNIAELLIAHFAVPLAGGVLVAMNVRLSADEIGYISRHSGAKLLIVAEELLPSVPGADSLGDVTEVIVTPDSGSGTTTSSDDGLPLRTEELYFELDGSFPNHEANPLEPANLVDLQQEVRRTGADIGLAFDGDADRCFVIDEKGDPVSPSAVTALVASRELRRHPGATILYNLISSRAVPEIVREAGGVPIRTRVGHSFIKAEMAATNAVFGGEHSAHYYFADFFKADTGMLAAMHVLASLGGQDLPLSEFAAEYERYADSGEINSTVADAPAKLSEIRAWAGRHDAEIDELDGLTVSLPDGRWFNVRSSNTEPLLRLNVEAADASAMTLLRDEILALIRT